MQAMTTKISVLLLAALSAAPSSRAQDGREQAVQRQLDRQVRGEVATQPSARGEDAVARLVRVLDAGTAVGDDRPGTPGHAREQLRALGPLAFETVYRLLPELGAFGTKNALKLLAER